MRSRGLKHHVPWQTGLDEPSGNRPITMIISVFLRSTISPPFSDDPAHNTLLNCTRIPSNTMDSFVRQQTGIIQLKNPVSFRRQ
ncbi:hypothetical protein TNCV_2537051 [Trichonephila clavipes]|nr:hypothetical protein TNCV_2537051 [Trichonephila clavipes]